MEGRKACADELIGCLTRLLDGDDKPDDSDKRRLPAELRGYANTAKHAVPQTKPQQFLSDCTDSGSPVRKPVLQCTAPDKQEDAEELLEKIKVRNREKQARHRARVKVCSACRKKQNQLEIGLPIKRAQTASPVPKAHIHLFVLYTNDGMSCAWVTASTCEFVI